VCAALAIHTKTGVQSNAQIVVVFYGQRAGCFIRDKQKDNKARSNMQLRYIIIYT